MAARELKFERPHNRRRSEMLLHGCQRATGPGRISEGALSIRSIVIAAATFAAAGKAVLARRLVVGVLSISAHQSVRNAAEEDARRSSKRRKYRRKKHHGEADASDTEADANDTEADASDTEAAERKGPRGSDGRATGVGRSAQAHVHVMSHGDHGSHDSEHGSPGQDASEAQQTQTPPS